MNKQDSKYFNTASYMDEALLVLLEKKDYDFITVKEVCQTAGVNRSTFYLHYTDIYDLLEQTENDLKNEILEIVNNDQRLRMEETMPYITELFAFIADNREIASALLGPHGDVAFMRQIEQIILSHCMKYLKPYLEQLDERTLESVNGFCIAGCIGLIISWMKHDFEDTPESMARMTYTLVLSALKPYMQSIAE